MFIIISIYILHRGIIYFFFIKRQLFKTTTIEIKIVPLVKYNIESDLRKFSMKTFGFWQVKIYDFYYIYLIISFYCFFFVLWVRFFHDKLFTWNKIDIEYKLVSQQKKDLFITFLQFNSTIKEWISKKYCDKKNRQKRQICQNKYV